MESQSVYQGQDDLLDSLMKIPGLTEEYYARLAGIIEEFTSPKLAEIELSARPAEAFYPGHGSNLSELTAVQTEN